MSLLIASPDQSELDLHESIYISLKFPGTGEGCIRGDFYDFIPKMIILVYCSMHVLYEVNVARDACCKQPPFRLLTFIFSFTIYSITLFDIIVHLYVEHILDTIIENFIYLYLTYCFCVVNHINLILYLKYILQIKFFQLFDLFQGTPRRYFSSSRFTCCFHWRYRTLWSLSHPRAVLYSAFSFQYTSRPS